MHLFKQSCSQLQCTLYVLVSHCISGHLLRVLAVGHRPQRAHSLWDSGKAITTAVEKCWASPLVWRECCLSRSWERLSYSHFKVIVSSVCCFCSKFFHGECRCLITALLALEFFLWNLLEHPWPMAWLLFSSSSDYIVFRCCHWGYHWGSGPVQLHCSW